MGAEGSKESSRTQTPAAHEPGAAEQPTPQAEPGGGAASGERAAAEKASTMASSLGGGGAHSQQSADASARTGSQPCGGGGDVGPRGDRQPPADEPAGLLEIDEIENLIVMEYQKPSVSAGALPRDVSDGAVARAKLSPWTVSDRRDREAGLDTSGAFDPLRFKDANKSPRRNESRNSSDFPRQSTPEIIKTDAKTNSTKPEPQYDEDEVELLVSIERDLIH